MQAKQRAELLASDVEQREFRRVVRHHNEGIAVEFADIRDCQPHDN